jgi:hypothetical protein
MLFCVLRHQTVTSRHRAVFLSDALELCLQLLAAGNLLLLRTFTVGIGLGHRLVPIDSLIVCVSLGVKAQPQRTSTWKPISK